MPARNRSFSVTTPLPVALRGGSRATKTVPPSPSDCIKHSMACPCNACVVIRRGQEQVLTDVAQKLMGAGFGPLTKQRVSLTTGQSARIELAKVQATVGKFSPRYPAQDCYSRRDVHNMYVVTLNNNLHRLKDPTLEQQRYDVSSEKEEAMYANRMFRRVSKALRHRLTSQDADLRSPEERKLTCFAEVEGQLERLIDTFPRFNDQRVSMHLVRSH